MPEANTRFYYPEHKICGQWKRWSKRGQDVRFETEQEARDYLKGVVFETRIETEQAIADVSQKGNLNGSSQGFSLLR